MLARSEVPRKIRVSLARFTSPAGVWGPMSAINRDIGHLRRLCSHLCIQDNWDNSGLWSRFWPWFLAEWVLFPSAVS